MNILHTIGAAIASVGIFIGSLFGFNYEAPQPTGDDLGRAVNPVATNNYVIAGSGISSSATTITLSSFTAPVSGIPYTMSNFGDGVNAKGYLTIEPGSRTRQEIVSFTGLTQNSDGSATLTGVSRGLLPFSPFTASTTYAVAHNGGSLVVVSNPPQLYDAIYSYIDNATTSGAVDAAPTIKGLVEVASGLEAASSTPIGGGNTTAPLALTTSISTSTAPTSGSYIPVTQSDGNISDAFLPSVSKYANEGTVLLASTTFTGATLPQPAYINGVGQAVLSDALSGTSTRFDGFVITNSSANASATLQMSGIVGGFTGLASGTPYYVQNTAGTIGTATGTNRLLVGVAVSPSEIAIQKKNRSTSGGATSVGTASGQLPVVVGFRPSTIRITGYGANGASNSSQLTAVWRDNTMTGISAQNDSDSGAAGANPRLYGASETAYMTFEIQSVTSIGFTIVWTESGAVTTDAYFMWEAYE